MPTAAINIMLNELRHLYPHLPKDARTLLGTPPRTSKSRTRDGGHYVHFGLKDVLDRVLRIHSQCDAVKLQIRVDGASLFKSSRAQLWPILGRLTNPKTATFLVEVFSGQTKPMNVSEYLQDLVDKMLDLQLHGYFNVGSGKRCVMHFECLVANAPARAFIRQMKKHSGYFSYKKCCMRDVYTFGRVTFPHSDCARISDDSFCSRLQEEHHIGVSPFEALPTDMVYSFPLDYMHLICLGVMKTLIKLWRS
ncbi:uncharacterized protein DEA37_0001289 [Paragonimus westermani]|uniref:Uncharacterized protein n=1 Tax=Paragonimus westermani TaxID=34504 RepID=A0A5J4NI17_9TREM|nr:uncharacterized protein DEA37_0001289 [Paragonimus westermani]